MHIAAFAGRYAPRDRGSAGTERGLRTALHLDGPAASTTAAPLCVAWTPALPHAGADGVCLIDGRPRTRALATHLGADPALTAEQLLISGYERLGVGVVPWLEGEFALLIWDSRARRGIVARDRLGTRPLFLTEWSGELLFASEIRTLLAMLPTRPAPDGTGIADWLTGTRVRGSRTLFTGIRRLPAAHAVSLADGTWRCARYWSATYRSPIGATAEEAASLIRAGMQRAVERSLDDAVRPGVMLSGGFDSAAVAATACARRSSSKPVAYSGVFPDDAAVDESSRIALVRRHLGMQGVEGAFTGDSALAAAVQFIATWGVPSLSPNLFVWLPLLRRAAAHGIDVMLDGEGGDELFGCAPYLVADRLRAGRPAAALATARRLPGMGDDPRPRWLLRALTTYGIRPLIPPALHERLRRGRARAVPTWLEQEASESHRDRDDRWAWKRSAGPRWWAGLADSLIAAPDAFGAADQLRRESAMAGLTARHALRDAELIDLVLSLPPELAYHPHRDRPVARRAMSDELPVEILENDEKPVFNSVLRAALTGPDLRAVQALLADPHPDLARRVRREAVRSMLASPGDNAVGGRWATDIWRLASMELWLRHEAGGGLRAGVDPSPAAPARMTFSEADSAPPS